MCEWAVDRERRPTSPQHRAKCGRHASRCAQLADESADRRICVGDGNEVGARRSFRVIDHVHAAKVGQARHDDLRDVIEGCSVVEAARKKPARIDQELGASPLGEPRRFPDFTVAIDAREDGEIDRPKQHVHILVPPGLMPPAQDALAQLADSRGQMPQVAPAVQPRHAARGAAHLRRARRDVLELLDPRCNVLEQLRRKGERARARREWLS
jgi:hypothetical protein